MKAFVLVHVGGKYLTTIINFPSNYGELYLNKVTDKVRQCVEENIPVYPLIPKTEKGEKDLLIVLKNIPYAQYLLVHPLYNIMWQWLDY